MQLLVGGEDNAPSTPNIHVGLQKLGRDVVSV